MTTCGVQYNQTIQSYFPPNIYYNTTIITDTVLTQSVNITTGMGQYTIGPFDVRFTGNLSIVPIDSEYTDNGLYSLLFCKHIFIIIIL